jgi:hypothetical protein
MQGIFLTTGVFTTESVQAAQLATSLWPGAQILIISSNSVVYEPDTYPYSGYHGARYGVQRVTPCSYNDLPQNSGYTNTAPFQLWMDSFVTPITNYLRQHQEIKMVALSYGGADHAKVGAADWNETCPILNMFLSFSRGSNLDSGTIAPATATNLQVFSFSCRTFADTTNLLIRSSSFDIYHAQGAFIMDVIGGYGAFDGSIWALTTTVPLTNYVANPDQIVYNFANKNLTVTNDNYPLVLSWNWGWYALCNDGTPSYDNLRRTVLQYQPLPNSISGSIESHNFCSLSTFLDSSTGKRHQTRAYDCFSPTANFGNLAGADTTSIPLYSRTYGCAFGHTMEPYTGRVYTAEDFYPNITKGYSFVEAFYIIGNGPHKLQVGHIVCGHPFMRITDFAIEGTTLWDVSGVWPVPY